MQEFQYQAVDSAGKQYKGMLVATDEHNLESQLQEMGYWLVDAIKLKKKKTFSKIVVKRHELMDFCLSMAAMLDAGIGIVDSIDTINEEMDNDSFKHLLHDISSNVVSGQPLEYCLKKYPQVFPNQMCSLINAAEYSGNLVEAFKDVADYLQWLDKLIKDVKQVSMYPTIVLIVVSIFILFLFSFVVPQFTELLLSVNVALPLITQVVVAISDATKEYWYLFIGVPIVLFKIIQFAIKRSEPLALMSDKIKLGMPIFGDVIRMLCLSRLTHNMAILTRSGVPLLQSLNLCRDLVGNRVIVKAIIEAEEAVNQGRTMSGVFRAHTVFPPTLLRMVVVGEETGTIEKSFDHISQRYDDEIPRRITKIIGILEPLIMVSLIAIVGTVVIAVFLPLMALMGSI